MGCVKKRISLSGGQEILNQISGMLHVLPNVKHEVQQFKCFTVVLSTRSNVAH